MATVNIFSWIIKKVKQSIAIVEDGDTASRSISVGKYVIWKGSSYIATSPISSGDTLSSSNLQLQSEGVANSIGTRKVDIDQGSENAGKVMTVNSSGEIVPSDAPGGDVTGATINEESVSPDSEGILDLGSVIRPTYDEVQLIELTDAPSSLSGDNIWTDGENIYYNYAIRRYVFNKETPSWSTKTWNGLTSFNGSYVWTDGNNIYYSNGANQYVLDKSTSTWSEKTWTGLSSFYAASIWTDGNNIYYSSSSNQYVLDKATSTRSAKTWNGLTSFNGFYIWTDRTNIYFSDRTSQYVLDKSTSTWSAKTWNGLTSFSGQRIWTDRENIYYSNGTSSQYILDLSTSTWNTKTWSKYADFSGEYIWTDGKNIYYSYNGTNYRIDTNNKLLVGRNGVFKAEDAKGFGLPDVTSSDEGKVLQVVNGVWTAAELQSASGVSF